MNERVPCPVCKSTKTIEDICRQAVNLDAQGQGKPGEGFIVANWPHVNRTYAADLEMGNLQENDRFRGAETCAECGVIYRPLVKLMRKVAEDFLLSIQKKYPLDAIAQAANGG